MSKFKVINLFDKIFVTVSIFLIIYLWINFFLRNLFLTFILSLVFSFACVFLLFYFFNKKHEKKIFNKNYLKDVEEKFLAFRLMSKNEKLYFLSKILKKDHDTKTEKNYVRYIKHNFTIKIFVATHIEKISEYDLINLIEGVENVDVIQIVCNDFSPNINTQILANCKIEFITKRKLYDDFFLKYATFPNCEKINTKLEKKKLKEIMKNFFIPQKAKSYFWCGLVLFFSSIILPYHYYYLIFATILLLFSVICKLHPFLHD